MANPIAILDFFLLFILIVVSIFFVIYWQVGGLLRTQKFLDESCTQDSDCGHISLKCSEKKCIPTDFHNIIVNSTNCETTCKTITTPTISSCNCSNINCTSLCDKCAPPTPSTSTPTPSTPTPSTPSTPITPTPSIPPTPTPTSSQSTLFTKQENQAIAGFDKETYQATTPDACMTQCLDKDWCNSVNFNRGDNSCFLQIKDNPISLATYSSSTWDNYLRNPPIPSTMFIKQENQAITGFDKETYQTTTPDACMKLCLEKDWCNSVDFNRSDNSCILKDNPQETTTTYSTPTWDNYLRK